MPLTLNALNPQNKTKNLGSRLRLFFYSTDQSYHLILNKRGQVVIFFKLLAFTSWVEETFALFDCERIRRTTFFFIFLGGRNDYYYSSARC